MFTMNPQTPMKRPTIRYGVSEIGALRMSDTMGLMCLALIFLVIVAVFEISTGADFLWGNTGYVYFGMLGMYLYGHSLYGGRETKMRRANDPKNITLKNGMRDALAFMLWPLITQVIESENRSDAETQENQ